MIVQHRLSQELKAVISWHTLLNLSFLYYSVLFYVPSSSPCESR